MYRFPDPLDEDSLRPLMADKRYGDSAHPEHPYYRKFVDRAFALVYPDPPRDGAGDFVIDPRDPPKPQVITGGAEFRPWENDDGRVKARLSSSSGGQATPLLNLPDPSATADGTGFGLGTAGQNADRRSRDEQHDPATNSLLTDKPPAEQLAQAAGIASSETPQERDARRANRPLKEDRERPQTLYDMQGIPPVSPEAPIYKKDVPAVTDHWRTFNEAAAARTRDGRLRNLDEGREHPRTAYDMQGNPGTAPETPLHATGPNAAINRWGVVIEDRAAKRRNDDYARHFFARLFAEEGGMQKDATSDESDKPFAGITSRTLNDMKAKYGKTDPELARIPGVPERLNESQVAKFYGVYAKDVLENAGGISGLQTIGDVQTQDAVLDTLFVLGRGGGAKMTRQAIRATVEKLPPDEQRRLGLDGFSPSGPFDGEALRAVRVLQGEGYGRLFRALLGDRRENRSAFSRDRVIRFR